MKIKNAIFTKAASSFFFDDQKAIKAGAEHDGFIYAGDPLTEGFSAIRQAGEAVSVLLELENGQVAIGDCAAVQYSGAGGRDPLFLADEYIPFMEEHLKPLLVGRDLNSFRENADFFDKLLVEDKKLHTAIRYGITQALLDAQALAENRLKAEVVCNEWNLPIIPERIPLFAQSGDDRYNAVDKMILKEAEVLPHALINNIPHKLGSNGEKLYEYIEWLSNRILKIRQHDMYKPSLHIDVYGTIGIAFDYKVNRIVDYLAKLEDATNGLELYIEGPVDMGAREPQIEELKGIHDGLKKVGSKVKIVADEWCNTFEDIKAFTDANACDMVQIKTPDLGGIQNIVESNIYCNNNSMESYQGGTCNETDVSARVCTHIAVASRPQRMLVKPGMGFDEGFTIVNNEMERTLAILRQRG